MPDHRIVRALADLRPGDYIEHPVIGGMKVASNWQAEYEEQVKAENAPTPSDQALRDLRAGVEALREARAALLDDDADADVEVALGGIDWILGWLRERANEIEAGGQ